MNVERAAMKVTAARKATPAAPSQRRWSAVSAFICLHALLASSDAAIGKAAVSRPGGSGHALLFRNHVVLKTDFKDFPSTAFTFEAWISSSDFCHAGTILSYAKNSRAESDSQRVADFNHFVIFDPRNILACHDFEFIDLWPDPSNVSCHAAFKQGRTGDTLAHAVERDGRWHHLAVTWDAHQQGLINIYMDGLLLSSAVSHKTEPLVPDGAFMLGAEQDCFGGCTDPGQGFHGLLDEVRVWRVARTQQDILKTMRWMDGLGGHPDLIAWWQFNEPDHDDGQFRSHSMALDSSGRSNHLPLLNPPLQRPAIIDMPAAAGPNTQALSTGALQFRNNFAMNKQVKNMPGGSFTIEVWAKGARLRVDDNTQPRTANILSYATQKLNAAGQETGFMDDALRIERVLHDFAPPWLEPLFVTSTAGSVALYINSNEQTDTQDTRSWMYFNTEWQDDQWHHLSVSWDQDSGTVTLLFDGTTVKPFWKSDWGVREAMSVQSGGVDPTLSPRSRRGTEGSLVLGQDQDCFGGCFDASNAWVGELAVVRVWRRVVSVEEVRRNMAKTRPDDTQELAALYVFDSAGVKPSESGGTLVVDRSTNANHLALRSNAPLYVYSTAPLALSDGRPVAQPTPGAGGYSLRLHDKQVLLLTNFNDFPSTELTLEFWMWSIDTCRKGVPFSYAAGEYGRLDNAFLLFNYNSWGVSVMEDEGTMGDHLSGVSATDGNWHHVAVTWQSSTGKVVLYDNARPVWTVTRGKGKVIPPGGTLVIGREQDCMGGCFDSAPGAAGRTSPVTDLEYGPQDFFGVIEEMRLWKVARTPDQIRQGMEADDGRGPGGFHSPGLDPGHPDLVLYYKFDEGQGYVVRDVTGKGHDLKITQPPQWEVTRWLSTCGNRVVEGLEECDDGDMTDGDGCSASCAVEEGWVCTGNPSICRRTNAPIPTPQPDPHITPDSQSDTPSAADSTTGNPDTNTPSSGQQRRKKSGGQIAGIVIGSIVGAFAGIALMVMGFLHRERLAEGTAHLRDSLLSALPTGANGGPLSRLRHQYAPTLSYDPMGDRAGTYGAPDFMAMSPAPAQRAQAPGHAGAYQPLFGSPTQHYAQAPAGSPPGAGDGSGVGHGPGV